MAKNFAPLDPEVKIPAAIRAAAAKADAAHKQAYETTPEQGKAPQDGNPQNNQQNNQQENRDGGSDRKQKEAPAPSATAAEEAPPKDDKAPPQAQPGDWEHKYNSMKGRYDRQEQVVRQLSQRLAELEAAASRPKQEPDPDKNPDLKFSPLISDQEKQDYGEDFLDVAARAAREKLEPEITRLKRQVEEMSGQLGGVTQRVQQNTQASMLQSLDERLENWREINRDERFLSWLQLPDPYSGAIRHSMLKDAYAKADAERVLRFFTGFLSDEAATDPAGTRTDLPKPAGQGKVPLRDLAAPGRAKTAAASPAPADKETISRSQIAAFYALVQKGHYRGNEAEKVRLEQMIFDAERDGRITD